MREVYYRVRRGRRWITKIDRPAVLQYNVARIRYARRYIEARRSAELGALPSIREIVDLAVWPLARKILLPDTSPWR